MFKRRKSINELQTIISSKGYLIRLISSDGTQQDDKNDAVCLGCNRPFSCTGDVLYRGKKSTKHPGCDDCQRIERALAQQERLDKMGKRIDIITGLYEGVGREDKNWVRCRDCERTFRVNGRKMARAGNPTPGCDGLDGCTTMRKRNHAKKNLAEYRGGPGYDIEEAQRKFELLGKPGRGLILEWNGTQMGSAEERQPAPARFQCECGKKFYTTGATIMDPRCTYNGCNSCGAEAIRQSNLKYDLEAVKYAIVQNQSRNVLDLNKIQTFETVNDRVTVSCIKHNLQCENKHLWALMNGVSPCPKCRGEKIAETNSAGWIETERLMREVEGGHIHYFPSTYVSRGKKMRKRCSKPGHNAETNGVFWQEPKLTIGKQRSSCKDCGIETTAAKRRKPVEILLNEFFEQHGNFYQYPDIEKNYVNDRKHIPIICPIHGGFPQAPGMHKIGNGCPECANIGKRSKIEILLMFEIGQFFPEWKPENTDVPSVLEGKVGPVDGILSFTYRIILEYDCYYWHQSDSRVIGDQKKTSILSNEKNGWTVYRARTGELPDINGARNIRLPQREDLKQYADTIILDMLKDGTLSQTEEISRYLRDDKPWLKHEATNWYYQNCRNSTSR